MRYLIFILTIALLGAAPAANADIGAATCGHSANLVLQVLGSGGPIADDGRASSGYLVWINGRSRFMIDAGGGTFLRFGEANARFADLSLIAISHFHTDHSADLSALLKSGYFSDRSKSLAISGPVAGGIYPSLDEYLERLIGANSGAYAYLAGYLDGSDGLVKLETHMIDHRLEESSRIYSDPVSNLEVLALGVPHGPVPALAYRINIGQQSVVFAGDQNGNSDAFIDFAQAADVLVMHMPVPENIKGVGRKLHTPPSVIGKIALKSGAKKLVLSHFMARSLNDLQKNLDEIRASYAAPIIVAQDLVCITF